MHFELASIPNALWFVWCFTILVQKREAPGSREKPLATKGKRIRENKKRTRKKAKLVKVVLAKKKAGSRKGVKARLQAVSDKWDARFSSNKTSEVKSKKPWKSLKAKSAKDKGEGLSRVPPKRRA